jgi:uncharacterized protein
MRPLAEQGDAKAQFNLGIMYDKGRGVPQDYATAASWWRKSAKQGFAIAQFKLGGLYYEGRGVPQDHATAVSWYRKSAEQGNASAQASLGITYAVGMVSRRTMSSRTCGTTWRQRVGTKRKPK